MAETRNTKPLSLSERELDAEHDPVKQGSKRYEVRAWITFDDGHTARIYGEASEWTSRAVHVHWYVGESEWREAWVWASAVDKV